MIVPESGDTNWPPAPPAAEEGPAAMEAGRPTEAARRGLTRELALLLPPPTIPPVIKTHINT